LAGLAILLARFGGVESAAFYDVQERGAVALQVLVGETPAAAVMDAMSGQLGGAVALSVDQLAALVEGEARPELVVGVIPPGERYDAWLAHLDLCLVLEPKGARLVHDDVRLSTSAVIRLGASLCALLSALSKGPRGGRADRLPLLGAEERAQILDGWNQTGGEYPRHRRVDELMAEQARKHPAATAISMSDRAWTYAELELATEQMARALLDAGVHPGARVGVSARRSFELVASMLGVMRAGCTYIPLDPYHPEDRIAYILSDSAAQHLIVDDERLRPRGYEGVVHATQSLLHGPTDERVAVGVNPAEIAYVLYTSGSTGQPKGVEVPHRALTNFLWSMRREPGLTEKDVLLAVTTISFDISGLELWLPLIVGARMVLATEDETGDGHALAAIIGEQHVTMLQATPSTWRLLLSAGWQGSLSLKALCGGEPMPRELARDLHPIVGGLWNMYGPTETTIWSTLHRVDSRDLTGTAAIPVGHPLLNTSVYVLDAHHEPVPVGVVGELYIGGDGVAAGYLGKPELSRERFVSSPFVASERIYRTGDLAAWREDGAIEFYGRIDTQVKVRGFRIELGEIEAVLETFPGVDACVVIAQSLGASERSLVAYLVCNGGAPTSNDLRRRLAQRLPDYMIPSAFFELDALPLTPSRKVDRNLLPALDARRLETGSGHLAPETETEAALAALWRELLAYEQPSIDDDFLAVGGHSLLAVQLASRVDRHWGVSIALSSLLTTARTLRAQATLVDTAVANRSAIAAARAVPRAGNPPTLSASQEQLFFAHERDRRSALYNLIYVLELSGPLDIDALNASLDALRGRHEALRTAVRLEADAVVASTLEPSSTGAGAHPFEDLSALDSALRLDAARRIADREAHEPFDLGSGAVLRSRLLRLGPTYHRLLIVVHHIAFDGWSADVLARDLSALYTAKVLGRTSALPPLEVQPRDVAAWERARREASGDAGLSWWADRIANTEPLELPSDMPRPSTERHRGALVEFEIDAERASRLRAFAQARNVTLFCTLLAAFEVLLARYSRQTDFCIGTPMAQRGSVDVEHLIGFFVNTLPVRVTLDGDPSFSALVERVSAEVFECFLHSDVPLADIVRKAARQQRPGLPPIFQVSFALGSDPSAHAAMAGLDVRIVEQFTRTAKFDLSLVLLEGEQVLRGMLEYNSDLFGAQRIEALTRHLLVLVDRLLAAPSTPISRIAISTPEEHHTILDEWNATDVPVVPTCIHQIFEARVDENPDAPALVFDGASMTFAEVEARANRVAARLRHLGVGPEVVVGLSVERSFELIIGLLGIFKSGGAYVPLDPNYPKDRLSFMIEDTGVRHVIVSGQASSPLEGIEAIERVDISGLEGFVEGDPECQRLALELDPRGLAYIIYTSGSTGRPKGVEVRHIGVGNLIADLAHRLPLAPSAGLIQMASINFDASIWELSHWLSAPAVRLVLGHGPQLADPDALASLLAEADVNTGLIMPVMLRELAPDRVNLPLLATGGEACTPDIASRWSRGRKLLNCYGPTEATVVATTCHVMEGTTAAPPIGRPIQNVRCYVLGPGGDLLPPGIAGELHISSALCLARGYRNQAELTADRFVADPFVPGRQMYRSGDLAYFNPNGTIQCIGRIDHQVKVRGFRIELGEIEAVLTDYPGVRQAVVTPREIDGETNLIAWVEPEEETLDLAPVRERLRARLPYYMVPARVELLGRLPLTGTGKVNRQALMQRELPGALAGSQRPRAAPRNELERSFCVLFGDILGREVDDVDASFFELGGHSLLAARLMLRVHKLTGKLLSLSTVFENPTIAALARAVEAHGKPSDQRAPIEARNLAARSSLPDTIQPGSALPPAATMRRVLITGVTGFLGAWLVAESLQAYPDLELVCLVRARDLEEGLARVRENLIRHDVWKEAFASRLSVLVGDLALARLGLDAQTWAQLEQELDGILHNGAYVNHVRPYEQMEAANVFSTRELLALASTGRRKPMMFVSTLNTCPDSGATADGSMLEERHEAWRDLVATGYAQSKWVAEGLVLEARRRGLEACIVRPGVIAGSSARVGGAGKWNVGDFFTRLIDGSMQLGAFPDWKMTFNAMPVDVVARWMWAILRRSDTGPGGVFHVIHERALTISDLVESVRRRGHNVDLVPYHAWRDRLFEASRAGDENALMPMLGLFEGTLSWDHVIRYDNSRAMKAASVVVAFPPPSAMIDGFLRDYRSAPLPRHLPAVYQPYFEALLMEPPVEPIVLRRRLERWVEPLRAAIAGTTVINTALAWQLLEAAGHLVDILEKGVMREHHHWIQASIGYLIRPDDATNDFESESGLDDDLDVHNCVARAIGRVDLCVTPRAQSAKPKSSPMVSMGTISGLASDSGKISACLREVGFATSNIIVALGSPDTPEDFLANSGVNSMMFFDTNFETSLIVLAKLLVLNQAMPTDVYAEKVPQALREVFERNHLVDHSNGLTAASVSLVEYGGCFFFADPLFENREGIPQLLAPDSVQTMPPHSSTFDVLRSVDRVKPSGWLLDVGSGCGVLGICLADRASAVDSIDINPRSVAYSRLNASLNDVTLGVSEADCMTLTSETAYDTIIFNSPSEIGYLPQQGVSTGYGDKIVFAFAHERLEALLAVGGRFASWLIGARTSGFRSMQEMVQQRLDLSFDYELDLTLFPESPFSLSETAVRSGTLPRTSFLLHSPEEAPLLLRHLQEHDIVEVSAMMMLLTRK